LMPSIDNLLEVGVGNVLVGAMNQAFFTLSLGIGSMAIFGSYIGKERSLMGESINILILDTFVAITAGLIIFPACYTYNIEPGAGPSLLFEAMASVFNNMNGGRWWGTLFFLFMFFAAMSTIIAVFENILACTMDMFGWGRKKASLINGIALFILSLPCVFGFNILSGITPFGKNSSIMDLEDFLVSNILLPVGSLIFVLFCTSRYGWGWKKFTEEANTGNGAKIANWMRGYMTFVLPVIIIVILVIGLYNFFK